jgi:hypothetical protein
MIARTVKSIIDKYKIKTITRKAAGLVAACKKHVSPSWRTPKKQASSLLRQVLRLVVSAYRKQKYATATIYNVTKL